MKCISLDFRNNMIGFVMESQIGTEMNLALEKSKFYSFIPEKYRKYNSYTWDFENEKLIINQDYELADNSIMTEKCFVPQFVMFMEGLSKRFSEFIAIMGYEEINLQNEIEELLNFGCLNIKHEI